jgi:hypothetical protein
MKLFTPLIVALLVLLTAGGLFSFSYYTLHQNREKADKLATQVGLKSAELDRVVAARATLSTLATDESTLRQYSVAKENIVPFLELLEATGRELGARVTINSVSDATRGRVSVALNVSGTFDAVMRTMGAIEYGPYDGVITNLVLSQGGTASTTRAWTAAATYSVSLASTTQTKP